MFAHVSITTLALISSLGAANIQQVLSQRSWLDPEAWSDNASPTGVNDYFLRDGTNPPDAFGLRGILFTTPPGSITNGASSNFTGRSLEVSQSETLTVAQTGTRTASILNGSGNLRSRGGRILFAPNQRGSQPTLNVNQFEVSRVDQSTRIELVTNTQATIDGELRGAGNLSIAERRNGFVSNARLTFTAVDSDHFSGNISVRDDITLDFNSDVDFQGSLSIGNEALLNVDQVLRFQSGKLSDSENGTLPDGIYALSDLTALGEKYIDGGGALIVGEDPPLPIFTVTTLSDEVADPGDGFSLREALAQVPLGIIAFDPTLDGGTIQLDAALGPLRITRGITIDATALPNGLRVDGGSNGDLTKSANETRCLIIDDGQDGNLLSVTLRGLTIQNGVTEAEGQVSNTGDNGANIFLAETLTLDRCQILDGRVASGSVRTGGIHCAAKSRLTVRDSLISGNTLEGINFESDQSLTPTDPPALRIVLSTISNNGTGVEATIGVFGPESGFPISIVDSLITENRRGISSFGMPLNVENTTIANNRATGTNSDGAGIRFFGGTNISLGRNEMNLLNCTFFGNSASRDGGAIAHVGPLGVSGRFSSIVNCTIIGNSAREGGGIENFQGTNKLRISNSLIIGNEASVSGNEVAGGFVNGGGNRIGLPAGSSLASFVETSNGNAFLQDNGGPTPTINLSDDSPAQDAGENTNLPTGLTIDQRGFKRIAGGRVDIGAVELLEIGIEITLVGNRLVVTEINDSGDNRLELSANNGDFQISENAGLGIDASSVSGAVGTGLSTVTIPRGVIDEIEIKTLAGNDSVILQSLPGNFQGGLNIDSGDGADAIMIAGFLDLGLSGHLTLQAETISQSGGIVVGGTTSLAGGQITLNSAANDFGSLNVNAADISLVDSNTVTLDQVTVTGDFSLETITGDILDSGSASILVDGAASFTAARNLQIDRLDTHIFKSLVTLSAERINKFASTENVRLGKVTATKTSNGHNIIESGRGTITLTDDVTTLGSSDLQIRLRGIVTQESGSIKSDRLAVIAISPNIQAHLPGDNDVQTFATGTRVSDPRVGNIFYNDINSVNLDGILADQLNISAGGDVRTLRQIVARGASSIVTPGDLLIEGALRLSNTLSLDVTGSTIISGETTLEVLGLGAPSSSGENIFEVIRKIGTTPIFGSFQNLAEGAVVGTPGGLFQLSYLGGDGNDIVLKVEPGSDLDADGLPFILERAIGTDPNVPSVGDSRIPSTGFGPNGADIRFTLGRGVDPPAGTVLVIEFSTTLQEGSFRTVLRYDFDSGFSITSPSSDVTVNVTADHFIAIAPDNESGFFRVSVLTP